MKMWSGCKSEDKTTNNKSESIKNLALRIITVQSTLCIYKTDFAVFAWAILASHRDPFIVLFTLA